MTRRRRTASVDDMLNLISEAGVLKRLQRSGWSVLGMKHAETVAEHSFRCCLISYILAKMEKVKPYKALLMALFNDMHEARITDLHKMAQRYIDAERAEDKAFYEQVYPLRKDMKKELIDLHKEYRKQRSAESIIARDADILECLIQAKEYYDQGFSEASKFMRKAPRFLTTKSAKKLWQSAKGKDLNNWWFKLSGFKR